MKHYTKLNTEIGEIECMQMNVDRPDTLYGTGSILVFTSGSDVATKDPVRKPHHLTEFILCMAMRGFPQLKSATKL